MTIKFTFQALLIYLAIAVYLYAFVASIANHKKTGQFLYLAGFIISITAFIFRWYKVGHIPFQNMFEVFLSMGMFVYPLSKFSRRFFNVGCEAADMLIGAVLLFPAGFIFEAKIQSLPPALQSPLFTPHVAVYLIAYVIMTKSAVQAASQLIQKNPDEKLKYENNSYKMACFGFPLLTLGLILGSCWAKSAWGDYWGWDPKELWSLATWLVYAGYFHYRAMYPNNKKINSVWLITGFIFIIITLLWVNLSRIFTGMHNYAS